VAELRFKAPSSPSVLPGTGNASNPLRDSYVQLEEAERLRQQGKLDRAETICAALIRRYPDYMGALHTLGVIHADKRDYLRALECLNRAAMLNPRSWTTLTALSGVYLQLEANEMAAHTLEQARAIKPQDASILATLGEIYREEREYELARDAFRDALKVEPDLEAAAAGLGVCCSQLGQYAEAAKLYEGLIKRGNRSLDLLLLFNLLPASVISIDVLAQLDKVVKGGHQDTAEFNNSAAFVRAAALDKAGRYAEAWEQLVPANAEMFLRLKDEQDRRVARRQANLAWLRASPIRPKAAGASTSGAPISLFILGPSRSGKTSMEKLVGALDGVKLGHENPIVENAVRRTFQSASLLTSWAFEELPPPLQPMCRDIYVEELARRAGAAKVFTNTHPVRIHDAARIVTVFPNVRFILVKRNPEDNMLRMFMQKYRGANEYAYDLTSGRAYLTWYHQMIDLLAEKIPGATRVIEYEDMVAKPAAALRVVAELCGLPMTERPLPEIGDDRGCSEPYRQFMAAALND
jgi:tetratricopeptide (TPR) repeat protein